MTKSLGWVVAVTLGTLSGRAQAQSNEMQHPAPTTAQAAPPTAKESEVVWLRRRVEQLEAQLADGAGACSPDATSKMKRKRDSSMPSGSMGDDKLGGGAMGTMPMNDQPMGKMKLHHQTKMNSNMGMPSGGQNSSPSPGNMNDM